MSNGTWTWQATRRGYAAMWKIAAINPNAAGVAAARAAAYVSTHRATYERVQSQTTVPWWLVGALHWREAGGNFQRVLHNGQAIVGTGQQTTIVPIGRGPFLTWQAAAVDALKLKNLDRVQDWTIPKALWASEVFNGLGYVSHGVNSPYVWAGTNHQQPGKYPADHVWDPAAIDTQPGVAAILLELRRVASIEQPVTPPKQETAVMHWSHIAVLVLRAILQLLDTYAAQVPRATDNPSGDFGERILELKQLVRALEDDTTRHGSNHHV